MLTLDQVDGKMAAGTYRTAGMGRSGAVVEGKTAAAPSKQGGSIVWELHGSGPAGGGSPSQACSFTPYLQNEQPFEPETWLFQKKDQIPVDTEEFDHVSQ